MVLTQLAKHGLVHPCESHYIPGFRGGILHNVERASLLVDISVFSTLNSFLKAKVTDETHYDLKL